LIFILKNYNEILRDRRFEKFKNCDLFNCDCCKDYDDLISDISNSKIAVYTAFTGDYDTLKDPDFIDENCDYICFCDNPNIRSSVWRIILMEDSILDNNRKAKQYKVFPHKYLSEYKYSLWVDGTFRIKFSVREYIRRYVKNSMLIVIHSERNDILDEFEVSLFQKRYPRVIMEEQVNKYLDEGFPRNYGLGAMGFIFRQHIEEISQVMDDWWDEIIKYSYQDQLSFPYVCWKNDFHPSVSLINYEGNNYWDKPPGNRHQKEFKTPFNSYRLLDKMENPVVETLILNKEELNLIKMI
jgi:hypothetical protein